MFLDLETVVAEPAAPRVPSEIRMRPGVYEGLRRLRQVADRVAVLVHPSVAAEGLATRPESRVGDLLERLEPQFADLVFVTCPHAPGAACGCAKPSSGLIEVAVHEHGFPTTGWHIGGDQEGVQVGRGAGLRTIRIGPPQEDHLSAVHRADYEARDLLDAANWILVQSVTA